MNKPKVVQYEISEVEGDRFASTLRPRRRTFQVPTYELRVVFLCGPDELRSFIAFVEREWGIAGPPEGCSVPPLPAAPRLLPR